MGFTFFLVQHLPEGKVDFVSSQLILLVKLCTIV